MTDRELTAARETGMSAELELMVAERAIAWVLTSYSRGVDRFYFEAVRSCYWPDHILDE
ncbi:MAG: hypothetical protein WBW80_17835 [Acidimicrobiales bacterium]